MSIPGSASPLFIGAAAGAAAGYQIDRSLRFNSADSAYLGKVFSSAGNTTTWTLSFWIKRATLGGVKNIFMSYNGSSIAEADYANINFNSSDQLVVGYAYASYKTTDRKFTDVSSWYHIVIRLETGNSTASDRVQIYVNGVKETSFASTHDPDSGQSLAWNKAHDHRLGSELNQFYNDCYLAEVQFIDGQALAASDFGEYDSNNVWQPKEFTFGYRQTTGDWVGDTVGTPYGSAVNGSDKAFDGNDSNGAAANTNTAFVFTPSNAITGISKVRIRAYRDANQSDDDGLQLNGTGIGSNWTAGATASEVEITVDNLTSLRWETDSSSNWYKVYKIEVYYGGAYYTLLQGSNNTFKLNFSDNSSNAALGTDSSGNSNTWTVNNLQAAGSAWNQSQTWSTSGTITGTAWPDGNSTYTGVFNGGSLTSIAAGNYAFAASDSIYKYTFPGSGLNVSSNVKVYYWKNGGTLKVNAGESDEQSITASTSAYTSTTYNSSTIGVLKNVQVETSGNTGPYLIAIEVDGNLLVDAGVADPNASSIDSLIDTPTNYTAGSGNNGGNYCTLNPLALYNATLSNGNLEWTLTNASSGAACPATIAMSSGKYYCEMIPGNNTQLVVGIIRSGFGGTYSLYVGNSHYGSNTYSYYQADGNKYVGGSSSSYGASYAEGDVIGIAYDGDNNTITFYKNGASQGAISITPDSYHFAVSYGAGSAGGTPAIMNFGQRPFSHPVSGYNSLCTTNLPDPTIADGSTAFDAKAFTANNGSQSISLGFAPDLVWTKSRANAYEGQIFDIVRGNNQEMSPNATRADRTLANSLTFDSSGFTMPSNNNNANYGSGSSVAWAWDAGANGNKTYAVKVVSDSGNKYRFDDFGSSAVTLELEEGSTYVFDQSDSSNAGHPLRFSATSDGTHGGGTEYTTGVTTTGTPGQSGAKTTIVVAASAPTLYYYCSAHSGMGGQANTNSTAGSSNFDGSIQSLVRANPSAGFSIVSYNGDNNAGDTVGHSLNAPPEWILIKNKDEAFTWYVYHSAVGATKYLRLDTSNAETTGSGAFNNTAPTSSVFSLGQDNAVNDGNKNYIAYCWAPVEGYSAFGGPYSGTGSGSTGAFQYCGFKPRLLMIKRTDSSTSGNWIMLDSARSPHNVVNDPLYANDAAAEYADKHDIVDFLSNGFKIKAANNDGNNSGGSFIWAAWAESPFKTSRAH